jgi:hypothetical protein
MEPPLKIDLQQRLYSYSASCEGYDSVLRQPLLFVTPKNFKI